MEQVLDDNALVDRIRSGNSKAFEQLYNRYWEPLFASAMHRLQSEALSKDVVQDLFVDLWKNRSTLQIRSSVRGYLFTSLKNRIINKIKSEAVREKYEKMVIEFYEFNELATEYLFSEKSFRDKIKSETNKLPERCREVFELSRMQHMTHKEIGEKLNISPKTVENHIGKALKIIRPGLKHLIIFLLI